MLTNALTAAIFDPINGWRLPGSAAALDPNHKVSQLGATKAVHLSAWCMTNLRPGWSERHELIHALFEHIGKEQGFDNIYRGSCTNYDAPPPDAADVYRQYFSLEEIVTYSDEIRTGATGLAQLGAELDAGFLDSPGDFARRVKDGISDIRCLLGDNTPSRLSTRLFETANRRASAVLNVDEWKISDPKDGSIYAQSFVNLGEPSRQALLTVGFHLQDDGSVCIMTGADNGEDSITLQSHDPNVFGVVREAMTHPGLNTQHEMERLLRGHLAGSLCDLAGATLKSCKAQFEVEDAISRVASAVIAWEDATEANYATTRRDLTEALHDLGREAKRLMQCYLPPNEGAWAPLANLLSGEWPFEDAPMY